VQCKLATRNEFLKIMINVPMNILKFDIQRIVDRDIFL